MVLLKAMPAPIIVKGDGTKEPFDIEKLIRSLKRSGAPSDVATKTAEDVAQKIRSAMTTTEIYRNAYKLLKKRERSMAARYSMRRAILELGPTGFPFEDYFCELMRAYGYQTEVRQVIEGRCSEHEVDVVIRKENENIGAELKFHNAPGFKTDLKTALYVRARFWDIEYGAEDRGETCAIDQPWLVTNTKFTKSTIKYAECAGLTLLGWSYPSDKNLGDMIKETGVYPVTVLSSLSKSEKARLLEQGVTLCSMIAQNNDALKAAGITRRKHADIISESISLCGGNA